jgi:hypothetical protein
MLSEKINQTIILALFCLAVIINIMSLLFNFLYESAFAKFLFDIGLTRWGWLPAILCLAVSLTLTVLWKPYTQVIRVFIIVISILMLIYDVIWLAGIYFISHLKP